VRRVLKVASATKLFVVLCALTTNAQTTTGDCNASVSGENNNVSITCSNGSAGEKTVKLVFGGNGEAIVLGTIDWNGVLKEASSFAIAIDSQSVIDRTMERVFPDQQLELTRGNHFYDMTIDLRYNDQKRARVTCSGVLNVTASAVIVPQMTVKQEQATRVLAATGCSFIRR